MRSFQWLVLRALWLLLVTNPNVISNDKYYWKKECDKLLKGEIND